MKERLLKFAKAMRHRPTDAETALWRRLRAERLLGFKFKRQQPLGTFILDFVCFDQRLVIEVDGGQHGEHTHADAQRSGWLQDHGFRVLRFWNDEVLLRENDVLETIVAALRADPSPPTPLPQGERGQIWLIVMISENNALGWLWISAAVIALDQFTKYIVLGALQPFVPHPVIPGFLNWTLAFNTGAAFSFLADHPELARWIFSVIAVVVSVVLARWLAKTPRGDWRSALPLALVIGGALGNLIDRVRFGHVTDFIQVYYQQWAFPSFNVADSAISIGAVLLVWFGLFSHAKREGVK